MIRLVRRPRASLITGTVAAFALAGCGGGDDGSEQPGQLSQSEYQTAIGRIVQDSVAPTGLYTDLAVHSRPQAECTRMIRTFQRQVSDLVDRAAELEPPQDIAAVHDEFVDAARESVDRVDEIRGQVEAGNASCGPELNDLLYGMPSSDRALNAIAELESQGYMVFGQ